jgi:hypothetical protein
MRRLNGQDYVSLWERGAHLHPLDRGLLVLRCVTTDTGGQDPADWTLGRRNRALAAAKCDLFGAQLAGFAGCPSCGERLEFAMDARELVDAPDDSISGGVIEYDGRRYRLPTSRDIAEAFQGREDPAERLAARCLIDCKEGLVDGLEVPKITELQLEHLGDTMARADPLAECLVSLVCDACGHLWEESLDLGDFVWAEIEARARRLLSEVHVLASAYGWTETDIVGLSQPRRDFYLRMVAA